LINASSNGYLDIVQYLISKGANIEAKDNWIFSLNHIYGYTSLISASREGHLDIVEYLISKGANIEAKNQYIFSQSYLWMDFFDNCFIRRSS
jgi:ankyrin repeat protein